MVRNAYALMGVASTPFPAFFLHSSLLTTTNLLPLAVTSLASTRRGARLCARESTLRRLEATNASFRNDKVDPWTPEGIIQ